MRWTGTDLTGPVEVPGQLPTIIAAHVATKRTKVLRRATALIGAVGVPLHREPLP